MRPIILLALLIAPVAGAAAPVPAALAQGPGDAAERDRALRDIDRRIDAIYQRLQLGAQSREETERLRLALAQLRQEREQVRRFGAAARGNGDENARGDEGAPR